LVNNDLLFYVQTLLTYYIHLSCVRTYS